jgi:hypothetical protein
VGSHWSATEQIDVVAVNWDEAVRALWRMQVETAIARSTNARSGSCSGRPSKSSSPHAAATRWPGNTSFFSRAGFTEPAQALARSEGAILVDLAYLDEVLAEAIR